MSSEWRPLDSEERKKKEAHARAEGYDLDPSTSGRYAPRPEPLRGDDLLSEGQKAMRRLEEERIRKLREVHP